MSYYSLATSLLKGISYQYLAGQNFEVTYDGSDVKYTGYGITSGLVSSTTTQEDGSLKIYYENEYSDGIYYDGTILSLSNVTDSKYVKAEIVLFDPLDEAESAFYRRYQYESSVAVGFKSVKDDINQIIGDYAFDIDTNIDAWFTDVSKLPSKIKESKEIKNLFSIYSVSIDLNGGGDDNSSDSDGETEDPDSELETSTSISATRSDLNAKGGIKRIVDIGNDKFFVESYASGTVQSYEYDADWNKVGSSASVKATQYQILDENGYDLAFSGVKTFKQGKESSTDYWGGNSLTGRSSIDENVADFIRSALSLDETNSLGVVNSSYDYVIGTTLNDTFTSIIESEFLGIAYVGLQGNDYFCLTSEKADNIILTEKFNAKTNVKDVHNFGEDDIISIDTALIGEKLFKNGTPSDILTVGSTATSKNTRLVFNDGSLYYDSNGSKKGGLTLIATIEFESDFNTFTSDNLSFF